MVNLDYSRVNACPRHTSFFRKARSVTHCSNVSQSVSTVSKFSISVSLARHSTAIAPCPTAYMHCCGGRICNQHKSACTLYLLPGISNISFQAEKTNTKMVVFYIETSNCYYLKCTIVTHLEAVDAL